MTRSPAVSAGTLLRAALVLALVWTATALLTSPQQALDMLSQESRACLSLCRDTPRFSAPEVDFPAAESAARGIWEAFDTDDPVLGQATREAAAGVESALAPVARWGRERLFTVRVLWVTACVRLHTLLCVGLPVLFLALAWWVDCLAMRRVDRSKLSGLSPVAGAAALHTFFAGLFFVPLFIFLPWQGALWSALAAAALAALTLGLWLRTFHRFF